MQRFAVVGHPVAHSLSPEIHAAFAHQTGLAIDYGRLLAPLDGFASTVRRFLDEGGRGVNVTVPFKLEAFALCGADVTARAARAGAVNCIRRDDRTLHGDNTDGAGLVHDLMRLIGPSGRGLEASRVLLVGAGGAARGVLGPLADARPASLVVVNRDRAKAEALVAPFAELEARSFDDLGDAAFDVIVNATSASLSGEALPLAPSLFAGATVAYDMVYSASDTPFMAVARAAGADAVADGLGMLVEQAAESFVVWHGVRPDTVPVLSMLRALLARKAAS